MQIVLVVIRFRVLAPVFWNILPLKLLSIKVLRFEKELRVSLLNIDLESKNGYNGVSELIITRFPKAKFTVRFST